MSAAIAYVGHGGAKLLPLRRGDRLVVDMSLRTVRAGATDPREIEKFVQRGVTVFTRRNLHSKLVVGNGFAIAGSANVSVRSERLLDEAAILTNDASVIRRARGFIDRLCTEPIRPKYLEQCKRHYRPPHFDGKGPAGKRQHRVEHAKLWIVNLREFSIPEPELLQYERGAVKARKLIKDAARSKAESSSWPYRPKMTDELERGDWIIHVVKHRDDTVLVHPPGQLLSVGSYIRDRKLQKERYVFHVEIPKRGEALSWRRFSATAKRAFGAETLSRRTRAVRDQAGADALLRLWTPAGRVSRR